MKESLLPFLRCPVGCTEILTLDVTEGSGRQIETGTLTCPGCGQVYSIQEGIPRLLPPELGSVASSPATKGTAPVRSEEILRKRSEMQARDAQAEDYDHLWSENLFAPIEIPVMLMNLSLAPEDTLLEAGCGTGRMTRQFATRCRRLISVDFSAESLRRNRAKLRQANVENVDLVQADLCALPFRDTVFDRVVSAQVLEHIPTPPSRAAAVRQLARVLRTDGNLCLSAYQYSPLVRFFAPQAMEREGEHAGGIYFRRFLREELDALLSEAFQVESITGALVYIFIARCRKRSA